MKTSVLKVGSILLVLVASALNAQVKKEWFIQTGYSLSAQTVLDYSESPAIKTIMSYFRFNDFRNDINFFYVGAEQRLSLTDEMKSKLIWGVYLSKKGFKREVSFISHGNKTTISDRYLFYYINFPLYIQRKLWQDKLYLNYGIVPSVMFYNVEHYKYERKVVSQPAYFPEYKYENYFHYYEKDVNFVDLSFRLGLSYFLNPKIGFDFYLDKGLININRNAISTSIGYQNLFMLGVRYKL
ncbi:MAG TPA: hypothetical protein PK995_01205 [Bacteroidia bacterium]|nr:hypothetical protein [Bacteroidia bacterium]